MEQLFIQLLGNSPVLIAVLIIYSRFEKRCELIEQQTEILKEEVKCLRKKK